MARNSSLLALVPRWQYIRVNSFQLPKVLFLVVTTLSSLQMLAFSAWFLVSRRPDIYMIARHLTFVDHVLNIVSIDIWRRFPGVRWRAGA